MRLYEKNMQFFKSYIPAVYDQLVREISNYKFEITNTDDNNFIIKDNDKRCFLHSVYDKDKEIVNMFRGIGKDTKNLVIFGFGMGIALEYIEENFKSLEKIVIIEPDLNLFLNSLNYVDMSDVVLRLKNVTFIINKNKIEATNILWDRLSESVKQGVDIVYSITYRSLYEGYFEEIIEQWSKYLKDTIVNMATNDYFLYRWPKNILKNLQHDAIMIDELKNKFGDIPAIIVSAGPSLNKNMELLKKIRDKAVIIAVGSAIKVLDSNGIIPHYRFAFDGSEEEGNIFQNINTENSTLVFSNELYCEILPKYKGKKVRMVLNTDYLAQYMQKSMGYEPTLISSGFSIANVATDAVIKLGFKKIIFIGQDLSYTEGSLYAKGSWKNEKIDLSKEGYIKTKNIYGEEVYTDKSFLGMKGMLERVIGSNSDVEYINATAGGLHIEGTKIKSLEQVMKEELLKVYDIQIMMDNVHKKHDFEEDNVKIEKCIDLMKNDINSLLEINNRHMKHMKKVWKYFQKKLGYNRLLNEIEYIEEFEKELEEFQVYREAIKYMLTSKFKSIVANYYYKGQDKMVEVENLLKIQIGKATELNNYLTYLKEIIEEIKNK